jgi:NADPH:quinone reductase-like Zn-dependent oxidoreductase
MKAIVFTGAGGNEVVSFEERPDPEPGAEDVLVWLPAQVSTRQIWRRL